jgi:Uncharacterized protein conserved in bacteria (DUF2059)
MKWILSAVFVAAIPAFASGADFVGTWKVTYAGAASSAPKTIGSMIFDFKINGGEVVGLAHIGVWPGLAPIAEGKVDGDHISFAATGYLPSTTGTPTCRIEGTLSGDVLVINLSQIRNPGGPGAGGVYEYRGGRLDAAAARAEKLQALATLSVHREFSRSLYPDVEPQQPTDFDAVLKARASQLAAHISAWELVKPRQSEAESFSDQDLDDLIAFYNSPAGQAMIKAQPQAVETALAAFLARR